MTSTSNHRAHREHAGFFSSAKVFSLQVGQHLEPEAISGYPIDMRAKAPSASFAEWLPVNLDSAWTEVAQRGLGCFERYVAGEGDRWLAAATDVADYLLVSQLRDGPRAGAFLHHRRLGHTLPVPVPWISGMAQGEAASLLVRIFLHGPDTGTHRADRYAEAAAAALRAFAVPSAAGGVLAELDGGPFFEEYPTTPASYVLNGGVFALWGLRDFAVGLKDKGSLALFTEGLDTVISNLNRWDLGWWTTYDLFPHPIANVASSFYQLLHARQLEALNRLEPRPALTQHATRWLEQFNSPLASRRAFAHKALFRVLMPRNRLLGEPAVRLSAWSRRARP